MLKKLFAGLAVLGFLSGAVAARMDAASLLAQSSPDAQQEGSSQLPDELAKRVIATGHGPDLTVRDVDLAADQLVPPAEQDRFWSSRPNVRNFVESLMARSVLANYAREEGVVPADLGQQSAGDAQLAEAYIEEQVRATRPDDSKLDKLAHAEYLAHPERYEEPEQVHVRHILARVKKPQDDAAAREQADVFLQDLRQGTDFAELARAQSQDPSSASRGGDVGWFARGSKLPEFEKAAFALQEEGEISPVIQTDVGYHIIQLQGRKPAVKMTYEEAQPQIREFLLERLSSGLRKDLWTQASDDVVVDEDALHDLVGWRMKDIKLQGNALTGQGKR